MTKVDDPLEALKTELEQFGASNDAATTDRRRCMLNITRDTGEFLAVLLHATAARRVLEIGTSNGYSTLWLAEAAMATGAAITTIESDEFKVKMASANFSRSAFSQVIRLVYDDAGRFLRRSDANAYDFIFLDSERSEYVAWWPHLRRVLSPRGLLVMDNATSHVEQVASFVGIVNADPQFATCTVPVGKGQFLAVKKSI